MKKCLGDVAKRQRYSKEQRKGEGNDGNKKQRPGLKQKQKQGQEQGQGQGKGQR